MNDPDQDGSRGGYNGFLIMFKFRNLDRLRLTLLSSRLEVRAVVDCDTCGAKRYIYSS